MSSLSTPETSPDFPAGHGHPGQVPTAGGPAVPNQLAASPTAASHTAGGPTAESNEAISSHAPGAGLAQRSVLGPRLRRLHARIGKAHRQAEGMVFSRALLEGQVEPLQLVALLRALAPGYALIEQAGPELAAALGATAFPWNDLARTPALERDAAQLSAMPAGRPSAVS